MENNRRMVVLAIMNTHRESLVRLLRARHARTMQLIRRSRLNLERMRRASFEYFREMLLAATALAVMNVVPRIRTIGSKERSSLWWHRDVLQTYDSDQWVQDFRMERRTFFRLVDFVREDLAVAENSFVEGLSVEMKVAIAVFKLVSCAEYRVIGNNFGVSKSTVCVCVHSFCKVFIQLQAEHLLCWPNIEECKQIAAAFEEKNYLPNIVGVIDGTHIPISSPANGAADFQNRKKSHSIVMQGVVDNRVLFRNVTAQHPGCNHDASVLRDSYLYRNHEAMLPQRDRDIDGMSDGNGIPIMFRLPYYIIGDPAYPLSDWLMKIYHVEEVSFNLYLNKARVIVENAFGRLKGRWRILSRKTDLDVYKMPHVIVTCCMLHNYVEMAKQQYLPGWEEQRIADERLFPQPPRVAGNANIEGQLVRGHLSAYMARHFPLLVRNA